VSASSLPVNESLPRWREAAVRLRTGWPAHRAGPLSIRWRLTLWYTAVMVITLSVFSLTVYWYMGTRLKLDIDRSSQERALQVEDILIRKYREYQVLQPLDYLYLTRLGLLEESVDPFRDAGVGVRVYDARGRLADGSDEILLDMNRVPDDRLFFVEALRGNVHRDVLPTAEGQFYAYGHPVLMSNGQLWAMIQILTSLEPYRHTMDRLARMLIAGTLLVTALTFFTGAALAQTALAPIDAITRTAQQINRTQDLSRRIAVQMPQDEIGRLTATVNDMLDRIQSMFDRQRQFLADVSHELRTPLTTIRGELDIMGRSDCLDTEALQAMTDESERMSRLIGDLLLLARAQDNAVELERRPVELDTLLLDVYRQARTLAGNVQVVKLGHEDAATVIGDRDRLKQLLLNLATNALSHSPPGTQVTLSLRRDGEWARLEVADEGPGIPPGDLPHIFDRFYRVDKARSRHSGGTGLGLSIVRWIATAHGGEVRVDSAPERGTTFSVILPLAPTGSEVT